MERKNIFIIEDHIFPAGSLKRLLESRQFDVQIFKSAGDLFGFVQQKCIIPVIVILPRVIPIGDSRGTEISARIKSDFRLITGSHSTSVILFSHYTTKADCPSADLIINPDDFEPHDPIKNDKTLKEFLIKIDELASPALIN